jgi:hypothetical protein
MQPESTRLTTAAGCHATIIMVRPEKGATKDLVAPPWLRDSGHKNRRSARHYEEGPRRRSAVRRPARRSFRSDLFVQTKFTLWKADPETSRTIPGPWSADRAVRIRTLSKLKTAYLDSLLLHSPLDSHARTMAWRALEKCARGLVLQSGSELLQLDVLRSLYKSTRDQARRGPDRFYAHAVTMSVCAPVRQQGVSINPSGP